MSISQPTDGIDTYAEPAVLGCLLQGYPANLISLTPDDFANFRYARIYEAIQAVAATGLQPDPITVQAWLEEKSATQTDPLLRAKYRISFIEIADLYGGRIGEGFEQLLISGNAPAYAEYVADAAAKRRIGTIILQVADAAKAGTDTADLLSRAISQLQDPSLQSTKSGAAQAILNRYTPLNLAELLDPERPEREWLWDGVIPAGTQVALVAPAGVGKSFLAQSLAFALARGEKTFAGIPLAEGHRVLYIDRENTEDDLRGRLFALGYEASDGLGNIVYLPSYSAQLPMLDTREGGRELASILDAFQIGVHDLVVLDSFQRITEGPENDADTLRNYVRCTGEMLKARRVTVIRLDNTGKDVEKGARGSSGKRDDVDIQYVMTQASGGDADEKRFTLRPDKSRLGDLRSLMVTQRLDVDGRVTWSTGDDPLRGWIRDCQQAMEMWGLTPGVSVLKARDTAKEHGRKFSNEVLRKAVSEWKDLLKRGGGPAGSSVLVPVDKPGSKRAGETSGTPRHTPAPEDTNMALTSGDDVSERAGDAPGTPRHVDSVQPICRVCGLPIIGLGTDVATHPSCDDPYEYEGEPGE